MPITDRSDDKLDEDGNIPHKGEDFKGFLRIYVSRELYNRVVDVCNQERLNVNEAVRMLLNEALPKHEGGLNQMDKSEIGSTKSTRGPRKPR